MDFPTFPVFIQSHSYDPTFTSVKITPRDDLVTAIYGCPRGFICNATHQAKCKDIQEVAKTDFRYGDIYGGAWCPARTPYLMNCPLGSYCPDPVRFTTTHDHRRRA